MTTELIEKQIAPLARQADELVITSASDMTQAVTVLSEMNKLVDRVTEEKEKITKPLNEALKAERSRWKPLEDTYNQAIELLRSKMSVYQTAEMKRAKDEADKIAARVGEGRGKLKIDTAVKKIEAIETPNKETSTNSGLVQFAEVKKFEIIDLSLLPIEYHLPNEVEIRKAMKEGKELTGVRYFVEQVPRNYR